MVSSVCATLQLLQTLHRSNSGTARPTLKTKSSTRRSSDHLFLNPATVINELVLCLIIAIMSLTKPHAKNRGLWQLGDHLRSGPQDHLANTCVGRNAGSRIVGPFRESGHRSFEE